MSISDALRKVLLGKLAALRAKESVQLVPPPVPTPPPPPIIRPLPAPPVTPTQPSTIPVVQLTEVTAERVAFILSSYTGRVGANGYLLCNFAEGGMERKQLDFRYWLPLNLSALVDMVGYAMKTQKVHVLDAWDCENEAIHLMEVFGHTFNSNGIGLVIDDSIAHAYNLAVTGDGKLWVIEPSSGEIWPIEAQHYPLLTGVVLL